MNADKSEISRIARSLDKWDFVLAAFTAVSSILYAVYELGYVNGVNHAEAILSPVRISHANFDEFISAMHLGISIALIIGIMGIGSRSVAGLLVSVFAYGLVLAEYAWWYIQSLAYLRNSEVKSFSEVEGAKHIGGLKDAVWLDVVVLVVATTLLIWTLAVLIRVKLGRREDVRKEEL